MFQCPHHNLKKLEKRLLNMGLKVYNKITNSSKRLPVTKFEIDMKNSN